MVDDTLVISKLKEKAQRVFTLIKNGSPPYLEIPVRTLSNTIWDEKAKMLRLGDRKATRKFFDVGEARRFMQTLLVMSVIAQARREGDYPTIRDIYYTAKHTITYQDHEGKTQRENTFDEQSESDEVIEDIEVMTGLFREEMGVMFDAKGRIVGNMLVKSKEHTIDLSKLGVGAYAIPPNVNDIEIVKVEADYVLVVEKGAIFERLNNEEFWKKNNCILVTGKGQPDRGTRRMIRRLWEEFGLPVYILTDADPYGFYIYSVYKYGSISLSYESERLAVPEAKFLGVTISDIYTYRIPKRYIIKATERDLKRAQELMNYKWFQADIWKKELQLFLERQEKVEIEAFSGFGLKFLTETYIPEKIRKKKYIA
ncbi:MAG TPA: DNA topoisomerase IV subunit A [Candidatus Methanomethylia archaeon]|nr:DNA topoisomerase IV subunit A [Candidatus Methanomethylicia archaeon]